MVSACALCGALGVRVGSLIQCAASAINDLPAGVPGMCAASRRDTYMQGRAPYTGGSRAGSYTWSPSDIFTKTVDPKSLIHQEGQLRPTLGLNPMTTL